MTDWADDGFGVEAPVVTVKYQPPILHASVQRLLAEGVEKRDARRFPRCYKCGILWRQVGNRTGHCSLCHRTFIGVEAFDRHQVHSFGKVVCLDPMTHPTVEYEVRIGGDKWDLFLVYFRIKPRESFEEMWERLREEKEDEGEDD